MIKNLVKDIQQYFMFMLHPYTSFKCDLSLFTRSNIGAIATTLEHISGNEKQHCWWTTVCLRLRRL